MRSRPLSALSAVAVLLVLGFGLGWWFGGQDGIEGSAAEESAIEDPFIEDSVIEDRASSEGPGTGKWRKARESSASSEAVQSLKAVPYLQGYRAANDQASVTRYEKGEAHEGLNLYVSGHAAEAVLMDMEGKVVHRWRHPLRRTWPDLEPSPTLAKLEYWRRAYLYPNGDLLAIFETLGLIKLDRDSNLLWTYRSDAHHDLFVDELQQIWLLDRRARHIPRLHRDKPVLEDLITVLAPDGTVRRQISILAALERSPYRSLVADRHVRHGDIFHTNTLERIEPGLEEAHPAFRPGNLLISLLQLNTVAVVDPREAKVVWALTGLWRKQHQPILLPSGKLLTFDNLGPGRERSRVVEHDPLTQEALWSYGGEDSAKLFSKTLGSVQRLANGNTLITESENGRALEVTRDGEIVWEFFNPHRTGENDELVATLFEVQRLHAAPSFQ